MTNPKKTICPKRSLIISTVDLTGIRIAILGWAFKANTNDSRESASIKVSEILYKSGAFLLQFMTPWFKKDL